MTTKARSLATRSVDHFLEAVVAGVGVPIEPFTTEVVLDATVPGWRFVTRGPQGVAHGTASGAPPRPPSRRSSGSPSAVVRS